MLSIDIPKNGAIVVVDVVDGGVGSASGGRTIHSLLSITLNFISSIAIQRCFCSPMSASIVIYKNI